jgi:hypothetical protein
MTQPWCNPEVHMRQTVVPDNGVYLRVGKEVVQGHHPRRLGQNVDLIPISKPVLVSAMSYINDVCKYRRIARESTLTAVS